MSSCLLALIDVCPVAVPQATATFSKVVGTSGVAFVPPVNCLVEPSDIRLYVQVNSSLDALKLTGIIVQVGFFGRRGGRGEEERGDPGDNQTEQLGIPQSCQRELILF